jgi:transposase
MGHLTMSRKEAPRPGLVKAALLGNITNREGAQAVQLSVRQFRRLKARYRARGLAGLLHGNRGRPSPRRLPEHVRRTVARLLRTTCAGFNDCHLTEKLREVEGLALSRTTLCRLRTALRIPAKRRRRAPRHRLRRLRSPTAAEAFLPHFLADFDRRFAVVARDPVPIWRRPPRDLDGSLACRYGRIVARDNTASIPGRWTQIPRGPGGRSYAGCRVELRETLDGRLLVFHQDRRLATQPAPGTPFTLLSRDSSRPRWPSLHVDSRRAGPVPQRRPLQPTARFTPDVAARRRRPRPDNPWRRFQLHPEAERALRGRTLSRTS